MHLLGKFYKYILLNVLLMILCNARSVTYSIYHLVIFASLLLAFATNYMFTDSEIL